MLVQGLWFRSPGRALPTCPSFFWAGLFPVVSSPGLARVFIPPGCHFSLQGLRGTPAFLGLRGSGYSYHYCASLTHMPPASGNRYDEPFIHLPSECLLLSKFVNSECFKKESQNGIPRDGNKRGTSAAVIGSIRTTSPPHHPPQKRRPHLSILALIVLSPGLGGVLFPPSLRPSL